MKQLSPEQFYKIAGVGRGTFKAAISRNEAALSFMASGARAGGTFIDLDVVAWMLLDELTPAFTRKTAAVLVRAFNDQWCEAVAKADQSSEPVFLIVIELGDPRTSGHRAHRDRINVGHGFLSELAGFDLKRRATVPDRATLINITNLLDRARRAANEIGVDLSAPFCPMPNDPAFIKALNEVKADRENYMRADNVKRLKQSNFDRSLASFGVPLELI